MDKKIIEALPEWCELVIECDGEREVIECHPNVCYPAYLAELSKLTGQEVKPDQYSVQLARRLATLDLLAICGPGITVRWISEPILDDDGKPTGEKTSDAWRLSNLPEGLGESAGVAHAPAMHKRLTAARKIKGH